MRESFTNCLAEKLRKYMWQRHLLTMTFITHNNDKKIVFEEEESTFKK